jgi:TRAP-type uncharacterized transport system fused permease subunit
MAQTRRRKKHRGTQAGTVRQRARGAPRADARMTTEQRRIQRMNRPPSWRSATNRAAVAASVFLAVLVLLLRRPIGEAIFYAAFMFLIYIPMGYYMDSFIYRWRQRKKGQRETP